MHKNIITAATTLSMLVRFLDEDELFLFMKYIDFVTKKFAAGEITDADEMLMAIDEFANTLLTEEDL